MNADRMLQRFLDYVRIDSTAQPDAGKYPSSPGQLELGRVLVDQLRELGLDDAQQDEHGIVLATLPSNVDGEVPVVGSSPKDPTHSAIMGVKLEERLKAVNVDVVLVHPGRPHPMYKNSTDYLIDRLTK